MAITMTHEEWLAEGRKRFGENELLWRFVCPRCGHVQCAEDFRQFQHYGATTASAYSECLGRYPVAVKKPQGKGPCDYAARGLFQFAPLRVLIDGDEIHAFAFAEADA